MFLVKIKLLSTCVCRDSLDGFSLINQQCCTVILVYSTLHTEICWEKLSCPNCNVATLCLLNDPTLHGHKGKICEQSVLLSIIQGITAQLENSYINRKSLSYVKELINKLTESAVKYADYLEYNLSLVRAAQAYSDEPYYGVEVIPLPNAEMVENFRKKDQSELTDRIKSRNFYDPISPMRRNERYKCINELKLKDLPLENVIVFVQSYHGGLGNVFYVARGYKSWPGTT